MAKNKKSRLSYAKASKITDMMNKLAKEIEGLSSPYIMFINIKTVDSVLKSMDRLHKEIWNSYNKV